VLGSLSDVSAERSRGYADRALASSLFVVGGAAIAAGIAGIVLNLPRPIAEHIAPTPLPGGVAVMSSWRF
jgi:hypothetical protein